MYFLLTTGRIVTEREMQTAYEVVHGAKASVHPMHYKEWLQNVPGIDKVLVADKVTVEMLVKGDCIVEAVLIYKRKHNCTLREAKTEIDKIKIKMLEEED